MRSKEEWNGKYYCQACGLTLNNVPYSCPVCNYVNPPLPQIIPEEARIHNVKIEIKFELEE